MTEKEVFPDRENTYCLKAGENVAQIVEGLKAGQIRSTLLYIVLIAAGLAGNYFKFEIFLNIDFLFGSIFAMLALQLFGLGRGIPAAAIIAGATCILWNHPYAAIIMTVEVAVVGWLTGQRKIGLVLADTLYWSIIGMPLVYFFYHVIMHAQFSNVSIVMTKQAVNGITNALIARLIFIGFSLLYRSSRISYRDIIYNLLAFFVLFPALIMLAINTRTDFLETDRHIRTSLKQDKWYTSGSIENWVMNRTLAITNLAEMAATISPQEMQPYLELAKKSDANFLRIGLVDHEGISKAFYPLFDELGLQNIGKNFADRPYIHALKQTLKPMLSEVVMGRVGTPKPIIATLAPVVMQGEYRGYIAGILSLEQIQQRLDVSQHENATLNTLIDKNGNVIMTNRTDQTVMTPFVRGSGTLTHLDAEISQWAPVLPANTLISERWRKSYYVAETPIGNLAEWKLILEQPVAPFQKRLYYDYAGKLTVLFLILLGALIFAEYLSRRSIVALENLRQRTCDLPARLLMDMKELNWPESRIIEMDTLCHNYHEMAVLLQEKFTELRQTKDSLLVSEKRFRSLFQDIPSVAIHGYGLDGMTRYWNKASELFYGYSAQEAIGRNMLDLIIPSDMRSDVARALQQMAVTGEPFPALELSLMRQDGSRVRVFSSHAVVHIPGQSPELFCMDIDITERRRAEQALQESEALYRSIGESIDYGVWVCTPDGRNTYASESFLKMAGVTQEQCSNSGWGNLLHPDDAEHTIATWQECVRTGGKWDIENRFRGTDGQWHHILTRGLPVKNDQGEIFCWAGINLDISRLKGVEERLKKSLAEKDMLLKEVHHRVKNNLQIISSLVSLQADTLADEQLQEVFSDVRDRVRTMALVHEKLYQSDDLARLDFSEYAHGLLNYLWSAHGAATRNVRLTMSITPVILPVEMVVNCGLILNELAANAIKHAFPHDGGGEVSVTLEHDAATGDTCLCVRDSGVGLPPDLDCRQASSLGLRLVKMLTKQIHGSLQTGPGPGAEFQIRFNINGIQS
ncbi:MAG: sensor histidine kinase [Desulfatirhabdiaceae bacterium]